MSRFAPFISRLEDIVAHAAHASFADCYRTAVRGAALIGFAVPSQRVAKRILDKTLTDWAEAPLSPPLDLSPSKTPQKEAI